MGAQASPGFFIEYYSGAPVTQLDYPHFTKNINIPGNPSNYAIATQLKPIDPQMQKIAERVESRYDEILEDFQKSPYWNFSHPPQIISVLIQFMAVLSLLNMDEDVQNVKMLAQQLIEKSRRLLDFKKVQS